MDGTIIIGTQLDTKSFNAQIKKLEDKLEALSQEYETALKDPKFPEDQLIKYREEIEKTNNKLIELRQKQEDLDKTDFSNIKESLNSVGNSIQKVIKKVTKLGLAIFGIKSAYSFLRRSMSTLSQYDDKMATNIEYIRYALATAIKPIIEWIISGVYEILKAINYLSIAWFNYNLFQNASVNNFKKMNKSAKELQKTISSFDELNVSSDNSSQSIATPSVDLSKSLSMEGYEVPKWLVWIKNHGKEIASIIALIIGSKVLGTGLLGLSVIGATIGIGLVYTALTGRDLLADIINVTTGILDLIEAKKQLKVMDEEVHNKTVQAIKDRREEAEQYEKGSQQMAQYLGTLESIADERKKQISTSKDAREEMKEVLTSYQRLYEKGKLTNSQIEKYADLLDEVSGGATEFSKEVRNSLETGQYTADFSQFANWWNKNIAKLDKNITITTTFSSGGGGKNAYGSGSGGGGFRAKGGVFYPSKLPKLAVGGIINMPGKGIPYNGAIIGERGAEAVVPLTDSQQMALLGEAIGRHINLSATIPVYAYNRQVAREIRKIELENAFAGNR